MFWKSVLAFAILVSGAESRVVRIECTPNCVCDEIETLRRANCDKRKLVNVNDNIPSTTEVLEFSYNYLSVLENDVFLNNNLTSLKLLNVSHNKIQDIRIYAFNKLDQLKTIDLSFNHLQFILTEWFWSLESLQELYLNNNNLGHLREGPLFESKTLKILDLSNCQLQHLHDDVFSKLPNLQHLDVSGNFLSKIKPEVLQYAAELQSIKFARNQLRCDQAGLDFIVFCKENGIALDYDYCNDVPIKPVPEEKFQRMVALEKQKEKNFWLVDEDDGVVDEKIVPCTNATAAKDRDLIVEVIEMSPALAVFFILVFGFVLGLAIGCCCEINDRSFKKRNYNQSNSFRRARNSIDSQLLSNEFLEPESTPMTVRRSISVNKI